MDAQALISDLANAEGLPQETLNACMDQRDVTVPAFLNLLMQAAHSEVVDDRDASALFFIIHLLAEMKVTEAYEPLMRLLGREKEVIEKILRDAVTETSHKIIISVFDGNTNALYELMNNPTAYEFTRNSAFRAWTYFVATGVIDRIEAEQYLIECVDNLQPQNEGYVWTSWLDAVATLGFESLRPLARKICETGLASPLNMDMEDFDRVVGEALSQNDCEAFLRENHLEPFTDTIGTFSKWYGFSEEFIRNKRRYQNQARIENPDIVTNPYRNVGRNDPCPCGSGKKFKKCCLN